MSRTHPSIRDARLVPLKRPTVGDQIVDWLDEAIYRINWLHVAFKTAWQNTIGVDECRVNLQDLYLPTIEHQFIGDGQTGLCKNRQELLQAMSGGGRIGIDVPYISKGCTYQWFPQPTICHIFERFHHVLFLGDESLQHLYNGLNMLLSSNIASGAVKTWTMDQQLQSECRCENQFQHERCHHHFITSSSDYQEAKQKALRGLSCVGLPCVGHHSHSFHTVSASSTEPDFTRLVSEIMETRAKSPEYKPIPIIISFSPYTVSTTQAIEILQHLVTATKSQSLASRRKTPILWIGPTAPGHIDLRGRKTNQEVWNFNKAVEDAARRQQLNKKDTAEVLNMWNLTVQASSWDGIRFSSKVAMTQAMMVSNWLSRLESS